MGMNGKTTSTASITAASFGVIIVRIVVYDEHGQALQDQPSGCFQVWQVEGTVRLLHACDAPSEAFDWLNLAQSRMFRQLNEDDAFEVEVVEIELASNSATLTAEIYDCRVEFVRVHEEETYLLNTQLARQYRKCVLHAHPILLAGFELTESPPAVQDVIPKPRAPGSRR